jgi:hypothetical protein
LGERNLLTLSVLLKQTGAFVMTLTSSWSWAAGTTNLQRNSSWETQGSPDRERMNTFPYFGWLSVWEIKASPSHSTIITRFPQSFDHRHSLYATEWQPALLSPLRPRFS